MAQIGLKQLDSPLTGSLQVSGSFGITGSVDIIGAISASTSGSFENINVTDNAAATNIATTTITTTATASLASIQLSGESSHLSGSLGVIKGFASADITDITNETFTATATSSLASIKLSGESGHLSGSLGVITGFAQANITSASLDYVDVEGDVTASKLYGTVGTATQGTIDHDSLANFVANEHIDHTSVSVIAGTGLTGGGTIAANRTLNVIGGTGVTANANDVAIGQDVATDADVEFATLSTTATSSLASIKLSGESSHLSGSLGVIKGFALADITTITNETLTSTATASFASIKLSGESSHISGSLGVITGFAQANITSASLDYADIEGDVTASKLYGTVGTATQATIDHDSLSGFVSDEHIDHTGVSVTAGTGLTGGGTIAATRTLNVIGGDGITANANDMAITPAQTTITSVLAEDIKIGEDDQTKIDFETANEIHFYANNVQTFNMAGKQISGSQASTGSFGSLVTDANMGVGVANPSVALEVVGAVSASTSGSFLNIEAPDIKATRVHGTILTATQATIDHDSLANFVADEHVVHGDVSVVAGTGLTGGGTIAANRTLNVIGGDGITANANDIAITAAQTTITSVLAEDLKLGEDAQTKIDFETANEIHFDVNNVETFNMAGLQLSGSQASTGSFGSVVTDANIGVGVANPKTSIEVIGSVSSSASGSFLNASITDNISATNFHGQVATAAQTGINSILATDLVLGEDAQTKIDFETANEIHFYANNVEQVYLADNIFGPESDSDVDLGTTGARWKDAFVDSVTSTGSGSFAHVAVTGEGGQISGSQSTLVGFAQANITSGSLDYINVTGLMTASGLETSGDVIAFGSSDRELKDNIQPIENPLEKMEKIGGYTFVWNDKQSTYKGKDIGVVAQEIQSVLPEIVAGRANGYLGVKYEKIVPLLIESIKEQTKQIKELQEKVKKIEEINKMF